MVFARKSRSEASQASENRPESAPEPSSQRGQGLTIDPFAAEQSFPDAAELAEKVVFKLWSEGAVKGKAIEQARREAGDKMRIDQALTRLRLADPEEVASVLAELLNAPMATDRDYPQKPVRTDELPSRFLREALAVPLSDDGQTLVLAMSDPLDDYALRAIAMKTRRKLAVKIACANRLEREIDRLYPLADLHRQKALPAPKREASAPRALETAPPTATSVAPSEPQAEAPSGGWRTPKFVRRRGSSAAQAAERGVRTDDRRDERSSKDAARDLAAMPEREGQAVNASDTGSREDRSDRPMPSRPKFIRPKRVTLKNKADQASVSRGAVGGGGRRRALRRAPPPDYVPEARRSAPETAADPEFASAEPGAIAAQVRAQVAARRAERERAGAEGRSSDRAQVDRDEGERIAVRGLSQSDILSDGDVGLSMPTPGVEAERSSSHRPASDPGAPLRFGEIRSHTAAAKEKSSPARRKVLDRVRQAIGAKAKSAMGQSDALSGAERSDDAGAVRYQASSALRERGLRSEEVERPADRPADTGKGKAHRALMPKVDRLSRIAKARASGEGPGEARQAAHGGDQDGSAFGLPDLTVAPEALAVLQDVKSARDGLILLSGPSGSGKIETVRKLAELRAGGATMPQRFDQPGAEFPRDVEFRVYWGEIRDAESAEAAARAAMTGALVLATLDASSAASSPNRLVALGLPAYALASSLRSVLSQTIEEESCTRCAETGRAARGGACDECGGEGRRETIRIGESMLLDDSLRALVLSSAPEEAFRHAIRAANKASAPSSPAPRRGGRGSDAVADDVHP